MTCLAGMNKKRGCTGAGQRGGNLAPDVAGLSHADDNNPTATLEYQFSRIAECLVDTRGQVSDRLVFQINNLLTKLFKRFCVKHFFFGPGV